ncbi:MAG TPA: triose-phosphate isomerase [Candidatus Brocadiia bacterium]|nr:triose-phosphate isomerase [Candidatus Brocadiales bacterium]
MANKPFIVGNWKMNLTLEGGKNLVRTLKNKLTNVTDVDVGVCPPFVFLKDLCEILRGSPIIVGAQNMHWEKNGAYTGEVSGLMIKEVGCTHVIIGHSERRTIFGETNTIINSKLKAVFDIGLKPIFCIGERLKERESRKTNKVVETQLREGLTNLSSAQIGQLTIAYEPVWAIGTGITATPAQAGEVHSFIRNFLIKEYGNNIACKIRIQYGGSVKPDNVRELLIQPEVDGALVGGASLDAGTFISIVLTATKQ